jgi:hypothetical protein
MSEQWSLKGTFVEACNCDVACSCIYGSSPTAGDCKVFLGWHVDHGHYTNIALDGLNVGLAIYTPGDMDKTAWQVALYYDDKASEDQKNCLMLIFSGQVGGFLAELAKDYGEVLGSTSVRIDYQVNGKRRSFKIADVVESEVEALSRGDGSEVTLINGHPVATAPGLAATLARSKKLSYHDHGFDWEITDKSGYFGPFVFQGS